MKNSNNECIRCGATDPSMGNGVTCSICIDAIAKGTEPMGADRTGYHVPPPALSTTLQEPVGELHGPYGWLNGHRALFSEDSWTLESDPLENSEEYFAIPLYALIDPFEQIGKDCCSTCKGTGEVDETLGGSVGSDPHAPCPDCAPTLAHQPVTAGLEKALEQSWISFCEANPDDLTSPEKLPDHALMTCEQFVSFAFAALTTEGKSNG